MASVARERPIRGKDRPISRPSGSADIHRFAAMDKRKVQAGECIYNEGDISDAVHFLLSGEVEVVRRSGRNTVVLGILNGGQIFGETGVIQDNRRSTTTRALTDITVVSVPKDEFLKAFGPSNSIALPILRMLCERLRNVDSQLLDHLNRERAQAKKMTRIVVHADTQELMTQIGVDGIEVSSLPFVVGRRAHKNDPPSASPSSLMLRPYEAYQIDLQHFAIEQHDGHIYVRDLGSHLGTCVNGHRIASFEHNDLAELGFGANIIQAGGVYSPYRFRVVVDQA